MDYARRLKVLADKHAADLVVVILSTVPPQPLCRVPWPRGGARARAARVPSADRHLGV